MFLHQEIWVSIWVSNIEKKNIFRMVVRERSYKRAIPEMPNYRESIPSVLPHSTPSQRHIYKFLEASMFYINLRAWRDSNSRPSHSYLLGWSALLPTSGPLPCPLNVLIQCLHSLVCSCFVDIVYHAILKIGFVFILMYK